MGTPKINIEPEKDGSEHVFPFRGVYSQEVNLPGCNLSVAWLSRPIVVELANSF